MSGEKLRFVAKGGEFGGPMVPHYESQASGTRRFVGRKLDTTKGEEFVDEETKQTMRHAVFVAHEGEEAIHECSLMSPHAGEYIRHLRVGDLVAADEFTASFTGKPFDPSFEHAACGGPPKSSARLSDHTEVNDHNDTKDQV